MRVHASIPVRCRAPAGSVDGGSPEAEQPPGAVASESRSSAAGNAAGMMAPRHSTRSALRAQPIVCGWQTVFGAQPEADVTVGTLERLVEPHYKGLPTRGCGLGVDRVVHGARELIARLGTSLSVVRHRPQRCRHSQRRRSIDRAQSCGLFMVVGIRLIEKDKAAEEVSQGSRTRDDRVVASALALRLFE